MTGNQKLYTKKSCKVFERLSFVNTERKDLLISSVDTKQKLCKVNFTNKLPPLSVVTFTVGCLSDEYQNDYFIKLVNCPNMSTVQM